MKITLDEVIRTFRSYNRAEKVKYGESTAVPEMSAVIVYKQSNFKKRYSQQERSYRVTNRSGKIFFYGMHGNSMTGDCLDGKDLRVRLDAYNWEVERCYFE